MRKISKYLTAEVKTIRPSSAPGTMSLWHGGNLDNLESFGNQKKGRYEYGSGLYLTTNYQTAAKYAKGSRRLYLVTITKGNDGRHIGIKTSKAKDFVEKTVSKNKLKEILGAIDKFEKSGEISFDTLNNILLNHDALKPSQTESFRKFIVSNGIDYISVPNAFGWGETMIVLFNLNKITSKTVVAPKDKIEEFDLPTSFNG